MGIWYNPTPVIVEYSIIAWISPTIYFHFLLSSPMPLYISGLPRICQYYYYYLHMYCIFTCVRPATFVPLPGNQGRCRCTSSHIRATSRQQRLVQVYVQPHSCHFQATKAGAGVRPATFVPLPGSQGRCRCTSSRILATSRQPRPVQAEGTSLALWVRFQFSATAHVCSIRVHPRSWLTNNIGRQHWTL